MPALKKRRGLPYRRKQEGKTDYRQRMLLLKSGKPRLVVRKSLQNVYLQLIAYEADGDKVLLTASTQELQKEYGWTGARRNIPSAYLAGYLLAKKEKKANIKKATPDIGMQKAIKGSILFAAVKGAVDGGLHVSHDASIFPSEERIQGKHIKNCPLKPVKENIEGKMK